MGSRAPNCLAEWYRLVPKGEALRPQREPVDQIPYDLHYLLRSTGRLFGPSQSGASGGISDTSGEQSGAAREGSLDRLTDTLRMRRGPTFEFAAFAGRMP